MENAENKNQVNNYVVRDSGQEVEVEILHPKRTAKEKEED